MLICPMTCKTKPLTQQSKHSTLSISKKISPHSSRRSLTRHTTLHGTVLSAAHSVHSSHMKQSTSSTSTSVKLQSNSGSVVKLFIAITFLSIKSNYYYSFLASSCLSIFFLDFMLFGNFYQLGHNYQWFACPKNNLTGVIPIQFSFHILHHGRQFSVFIQNNLI